LLSEADGPKIRAFVNLPGWGSWAGAGCVDKYKDTLEARHNARILEAQTKAAASRQDAGKAHVILNEKRNKKTVKYCACTF
jgi:U3 small nucleolar RNA-associated protein 14